MTSLLTVALSIDLSYVCIDQIYGGDEIILSSFTDLTNNSFSLRSYNQFQTNEDMDIDIEAISKTEKKRSINSKVVDRAHVRKNNLVKGADTSRQRS